MYLFWCKVTKLLLSNVFVYKQLHTAAAIICAVATLTITPDAAPIPIPSPMTPTKIAPAGNMPESATAMPEATAILSATIPIPLESIPISSEPHLISSEPKPLSPEPHLIPSEPTVKLGSWHEIVIAKPAIMTASPAITISHPAIRINTISTHAARVSAFATWVEMVMKVVAVAPPFLLGMPLLQVKLSVYLYKLTRIESFMLSMKDIPQLIGYTLGIAYLYIRVVVRVSIYLVINAAILDIIFQFHGEGSIGLAVGKLGTLHLERRNMVGYYNLRSGFAA